MKGLALRPPFCNAVYALLKGFREGRGFYIYAPYGEGGKLGYNYPRLCFMLLSNGGKQPLRVFQRGHASALSAVSSRFLLTASIASFGSDMARLKEAMATSSMSAVGSLVVMY